MSVIATAVKHLLAAGVTGEALVDAIAEMETAQPKDAAAERRRAWDRNRKRVEAAEKKANSTGIPPESAESAESAESPSLSRPPNENNSNPPTHTHPENKPRARKGHRLPVDWQPGALTGEIAADVAIWPDGAMERELARFRDWAASATGPNATKSDWQAAWRNWLRKAHDEGRYLRHDRQQRSPNGPRSFDGRDGVAKALDRRLGLDDAPGAFGRRDAGESGGYCALPAPAARAV